MKRLHQSTWFSCLKNANFKRAIVTDSHDAVPHCVEGQGHPLWAEMYPVLRHISQSNTPIKANYWPNRR